MMHMIINLSSGIEHFAVQLAFVFDLSVFHVLLFMVPLMLVCSCSGQCNGKLLLIVEKLSSLEFVHIYAFLTLVLSLTSVSLISDSEVSKFSVMVLENGFYHLSLFALSLFVFILINEHVSIQLCS